MVCVCVCECVSMCVCVDGEINIGFMIFSYKLNHLFSAAGLFGCLAQFMLQICLYIACTELILDWCDIC